MENIQKIYDLLSDQGFKDPRSGNLFFPAYIYTYKPENEYEIRKQIAILNDNLKRPNQYLESLVINIFQEIIAYLKGTYFAQQNLFDQIINQEKEDPESAFQWVKDEIRSDEFYNFIENKVITHFANSPEKRVYLIIHGFGSAFPYLRASELLKKTERLIKEFKLIIFYPGTYEKSQYSLFSKFNDDNMYRANHLNLLLNT